MNFASRVLLIIVLIIAGFFFPLAWLGAAIVCFTIFAEVSPRKARKDDGRFPHLASDPPDWYREIVDCTESPAEVAFLDMMIACYDLKPVDRALRGNGLVLRMQVEVEKYRLDFLVDDNLVVEIDGLQWHGSPEAKARDAERDAALAADGYAILRIPAKIALYDKNNARDLVESKRRVAVDMLVRHNAARKTALRRALRPKTVSATAGSHLAGVGRFVEDLNKRSSEMLAAQKAREIDPEQIAAVVQEMMEMIGYIESGIERLRTSLSTNMKRSAASFEALLQEKKDTPTPTTLSTAQARLAGMRAIRDSVETHLHILQEIGAKPEHVREYDAGLDSLRERKQTMDKERRAK